MAFDNTPADPAHEGPLPDELNDKPEGESAEDSSEESDEEILKTARARLLLAQEAESDIRKAALDDLEFRAGNQWAPNIANERERDGRPCLVINRLPQFVQQVTNDQRQNRPAIKVHPVNDGANQETAKVIQGLIRHIEYNSNAEAAYDTAFESAAGGGFGYFRVATDYTSPESFDQEIYIKRIRNPFSVFFDPYAQEPDGSDAGWAFVTDDMSPDDYRAKYPDSDLARQTDWNSIGNRQPGWVKAESVRLAEYFYKELKSVTLHLLATGETVKYEDLLHRMQAAHDAGLQAHVVQSRHTKIPVIKWIKTNGSEILEQTDWPGIYIPIVPVYGAELYIDGKRILESVIRHAKDPQRMYNYWKSAETETIALAPRTPWVGAEGQFEGHEEQWKTANRRNHAFLQYKPTSSAGQMAPPPQRQAFEPAVQAITQASMMAADDLKATTGIYDSQVGRQGNETSGIAIQRRSSQGQTSNFHFTDNLTRSLRHAGRILVDLIPKIYDTARSARIVGDDGEHNVVLLNAPHKDDAGKDQIYALDAGRYDVTIDTGPSFASKRQEGAASMMDLARSSPQIMQSAPDLIVKNMDWPGAQEVADRLKRTLPPGLVVDPKTADIPPQVQAQISQMQHMIEQLSGHLNEATKVIETKKLDLEHRERVEIMKLQVESEIAMAKMGSAESMALLKHEVAAISTRLQLLGINQPIQLPQNFDPQQADGGNYAGVGHIGGSENLTGEASPGSSMEGNQP